MRILLIEDDRILGETLKDYLAIEGIETVWIWDERQLPKIIKNYEFDVLVIDLILKYTKGEDIISVLRKTGIQTPIMIITAKRNIEDKENCFLRGADDYLTKPFDFKELVMRLKVLGKVRHVEDIVNIGDITINLDAKTIYKGEEEIKLSKTAWKLLYLLLKKKGQIVDIDTILNYIWPNKDRGDEIVRAYIKELRKVLPPQTIKTYPGKGYSLEV
ncbi:MAG: response regulator transcription factor [Thermodesulfovibrio sp.]|nr:response regulator transcription factor [Thermodesulfovibrio sp.]